MRKITIKLTSCQIELIKTALAEYSDVCLSDCEMPFMVNGFSEVKIDKKSGLYSLSKGLNNLIVLIERQQYKQDMGGKL